ncbi:MAG: hypothetical protein UT48_C0009G0019 [Parcubacteria group bacterium GW2011_GWE2_39_37]|nr:MAG: hypothetical protein UT48_C0009G0019 [Parcubacteria group bacterium GW2011_GWE2_39_37]
MLNQEIYLQPIESGNEEIEKEYADAKGELEKIFDKNPVAEYRINEIIKRIKPIINNVDNADLIMADLSDCKNITNKPEFIEKVFCIIKPLVDIKINNSIKISGDRDFIEVSEALSYGIDGEEVHIHLVPEGKVNLLESIELGLKKLAEIVKENETIKIITATSTLVERNPRVVKLFGFTVDGKIDETTRQRHFAGEKREVWAAHMTREDFLNRYSIKQ